MNPAAFLEIDPDGPLHQRHWLNRRALIGRSAGAADIVMDDPSVSRKHAEIFIDPGGRWALRDLNSHNGTTVNGENITSRSLNDGDSIRFGTVPVRFAIQPVLPAFDSAGLELNEASLSFSSVAPRPTSTISADDVMAVLKFGERLDQAETARARLQLLLELAVQESVGAFHASALRVVTGDDDQLDLSLLAPPVPNDAREPAAEARLSRSLLREALRRREPVVATHDGDVSHFGADFSIAARPRGHAAAAFILEQIDARTSDVLYVTLPAASANVQWVMLLTLAVEQFRRAQSAWAQRAAAEERAVIGREMELATSIQSRTLPSAGAAPALDWAILFEPSRAVGGDYVDVVTREDGTVLLIIADVSGKGVQAALVTAGLHAVVHTLGQSRSPLQEFVLDAQRYLQTFLPDTSFVTCAVILLDPGTGACTSINCGHPPFVIVTASGDAQEIGEIGENFPLGVGQTSFVETSFHLSNGEWLVGVTDGLTEMRNSQGAMLGSPQLITQIGRACAGASVQRASDVVNAVEKWLREYRGTADAHDDQTLLAARIAR